MTSTEPPFGQLAGLVQGYIGTQLVCMAARLGLADLLADGALAAAELARRTGCRPAALARFLAAMATRDIVVRAPDGRYGSTELLALLRAQAVPSLLGWTLQAVTSYEAWGLATETARTGRPGFELRFGESVYQRLTHDAEMNAAWNRSMQESNLLWVAPTGILAGYDWAGIETVLDVGGGHGTMAAALCARYPGLRATVVDQPVVAADAPAFLAAAGVADRVRVVAADFFTEIPAGADTFLLSRVLLNWDDEDAGRLLGVCRRAMRPDSRLLIVEPMLHPELPVDPAAGTDVYNFVLFGGRCRSQADYQALLRAAGLVLVSVSSNDRQWSLLEAAPASGRPAD